MSYNGETDVFHSESNSSIELLRANNICEGALVLSDTLHVRATRAKPHQILQDNDILICMANGSKALVGKSTLFHSQTKPYTFGAFMGAFRCHKKENAPFISYLLQSAPFHKSIDLILAGSSINNLNPSEVMSLEFLFPPPYDQHRIATSLSSIDSHILSLSSLISKCEAIKKATVNLLLKPRVGCATVRLGDVAGIFRGGSPRPIQDYITDDVNGINWIKIGDVATNAKFIECTKERIKPSGVAMSRQVKAGDFLLSNSMSFGRPYILKIDGCIHDGWLAIQNYETAFDVDYLYYLLGSEPVFAQYLENAAGSSVKNLNKEIVSNIILPLVPLHEQRKIAARISAIDDALKDCRAQLAKAKSIKQGMMSYFFG